MAMVDGKYAVVTGGGTGIGLGIVRRLLQEGAASVTIGGRREDVLKSAVAQLADEIPGATIRYQVCDVTDEEQVKALVDAACDANGELDIMVANAGNGFPSPILEADANIWRSMLELNIMGPLFCTKYAAQRMKNKGGAIINISSTEGGKVSRFMGSYGTSKSGQEKLTQCAALELAPFNIRVNGIRPGYIPTDAIEVMPDKFLQSCIDATPLGRPGTPEEIGDGVLYFASDLGKWTTGQILAICGGMSLEQGEDFGEMAAMICGQDVINACLNK